ncbi:SDR family NAD(P)-dependent oxidoreductase [Dokdonella sp. MW10]|uniref:SDR family NAD(P)-dependent oxidoreductase n=1 Tax=Dokdonella sp. MW10 TaxID=2992926 RepID=UPI003F8036A2
MTPHDPTLPTAHDICDGARRRVLGSLLLPLLAPLLARGAAGASDVPFAPGTTAEAVTTGFDLRGRTALVTGCSSGIGLETMRVLAMRGAHVIGTARTQDKAREACSGVAGMTTPVALELSDFDSVVACAEAVRALELPVDMLICNAGIVLDTHEQVRGLEKQFVVNHLGHFLLVNRVLDRVTAAPQGRVVVLGSGDHGRAPPGGIQFDDLSGKGWYARGYSHSKLANGLFSLELARRLQGTRATSNCVTPGHARTNILRNVGSKYRDDARTPAQAAATPCHVATSPTLATANGLYFRDGQAVAPDPMQRDAAMARRLWQVSEDLVRDHLA